MVVVEGVARTLDTQFNMWAASEPVVAEWMERYLGPVVQLEMAAEGVTTLGRLVSELPRLADRAERLSAELDRMGEMGLRLDPETVSAIGRSEARASRWTRAALVAIALVAVFLGLRFLI
jgi:ubiquinone biosynthesis protein